MITPNQIVVATDFSPASNAAVSVASRIAPILQAKVTLLHVFQYVPKHRYRVPVGWMVEIIREDVRSKLEEAQTNLREAGTKTEAMILEGIPALQIEKFVQACESLILMMGTHASAGIERFLLGSTAEEVLRQVACPVITVGPGIAPTAEPTIWLQKMLFATDFSRASTAAIPFLRMLMQTSDAHLQVLHVVENRTGEVEEDRQFAPIRQALQGTRGTGYITLHGTDISQAVVNEAERYSADLVVLGVQRTTETVAHLAPKIAFQIIAAAPCPVLTISS